MKSLLVAIQAAWLEEKSGAAAAPCAPTCVRSPAQASVRTTTKRLTAGARSVKACRHIVAFPGLCCALVVCCANRARAWKRAKSMPLGAARHAPWGAGDLWSRTAPLARSRCGSAPSTEGWLAVSAVATLESAEGRKPRKDG